MAKPKTEELQKHTLNLRAGDLDALASLFPGKSPTVMLRRIVSRFIDKTKAAVAEKTPNESIDP